MNHSTTRTRLATVGITAAALTLTACSSSTTPGSSSSGSTSTGMSNVTITLAGPNQWNADAKSFGPAWEKLIADFKAETGITVNTTVLPIDKFSQTISTQLAAGTAPELVFNQAPHEPFMVKSLTEELAKPNPFVEGNTKWLDVFNPTYFGPNISKAVNQKGDLEYIPFNLVGIGLFVNKDVFDKAGVQVPIKTFDEMLMACDKLREQGVSPMAMDSGDLGIGWSASVISNMLLAKYKPTLNVFDTTGKAGTAEQMTGKDWAKAVLTGEITTKTPEVAASVEALKAMYDRCATKNWSGIAPASGGIVGFDEFVSGKAGMAWGVNFGFTALEKASFTISSMPFPTITTATTPLASGQEAQYGASIGGTSYMIPAKIEGEKYAAALKFLQFVSAPKHIQTWLQSTGGIPAVKDATAPEGTKGFYEGTWGEQMLTGGGMPAGPAGTSILSLYDGYFLGRRDLAAQLDYMQSEWTKNMKQQVKDNKWTDEWAK